MRRWHKLGLVSAVSMMLSASGFALAATPTPTPAVDGSPGQGLEISPPVIELSAKPGQTVTTSISVRNVTTGELIATGHADDFGAGNDENGEPKILINETGATRYSLKYWIQGVPDLTLAPQELQKTTVTIAVPADAEPGGHFGVVRFTAVPPNLKGTGVALSASVGTLILMKVEGPVTEHLSVDSFQAQKAGAAISQAVKPGSFFENGPVDFVVRVKNDGTVHEKPQGSINVYNMVGRKVDAIAVNPHGGNVLPDSVRKFQQETASKKLFGRYTAKLDLNYAGNMKLSSRITFWVIPWRLILIVMLALVILFFLLRVGIRKYNENIISKARGR
jgi:hypothetical protein